MLLPDVCVGGHVFRALRDASRVVALPVYIVVDRPLWRLSALDQRDGPHSGLVPDEGAAQHAGPGAEDVYAAVGEANDDPVVVDGDGGGDGGGRGRGLLGRVGSVWEGEGLAGGLKRHAVRAEELAPVLPIRD